MIHSTGSTTLSTVAKTCLSCRVQHQLLALILTLVYASVLTSLPQLEFLDRDNYLTYARYSDEILTRYVERGPMSVLFNEPLWLLINIGLSKLFASETVLSILIFVPAFLVSWLMLRHNPQHFCWMIAILLIPQVIKNHIIHLRQGLGLAIFLLGYFSSSKWRGRTLMLAACFVHASFIFIGLIFASVHVIGQLRLSPRLRTIILLLCFCVVGVMAGTVASLLGARQGDGYSNLQASTSGLGFLFWAMAMGIFLSAGRNFLQAHMVSLAIVAFYLSTYFTLPVTARIFESGLLLVLMSGFALPGWRRQTFLLLVLSYALIHYGTQLGRPWLGWGLYR